MPNAQVIEGRQVLELLRQLIEIPNGVRSLTLHVQHDAPVEVELTYVALEPDRVTDASA